MLLDDENNCIINKGYYEYSFDTWNNLRNESKVTSPIFEICDHKW